MPIQSVILCVGVTSSGILVCGGTLGPHYCSQLGIPSQSWLARTVDRGSMVAAEFPICGRRGPTRKGFRSTFPGTAVLHNVGEVAKHRVAVFARTRDKHPYRPYPYRLSCGRGSQESAHSRASPAGRGWRLRLHRSADRTRTTRRNQSFASPHKSGGRPFGYRSRRTGGQDGMGSFGGNRFCFWQSRLPSAGNDRGSYNVSQ